MMAEVNYKRRIGDRKDGRQLRSMDSLSRLSTFVVKKRTDATCFYSGTAEVSSTEQWLIDRRAAGYKGLGMLHLFIAAYVRTLAARPGVNRFVSGQRIYARHQIEIVLKVRRTASQDSSLVTVKIVFDPSDTVFDIYRKLGAKVDEVMADTNESGAERIAANLIKLPRMLMRWAVGLIKLFDYNDWLPSDLLDSSPWHGSLCINDMGTYGTAPFETGLHDFGNIPLNISFGAKRTEIVVEGTGRAVQHEFVDYKASFDERICEASYIASAFRYLEYYLSNPEQLEIPPEKVAEDIF